MTVFEHLLPVALTSEPTPMKITRPLPKRSLGVVVAQASRDIKPTPLLDAPSSHTWGAAPSGAVGFLVRVSNLDPLSAPESTTPIGHASTPSAKLTTQLELAHLMGALSPLAPRQTPQASEGRIASDAVYTAGREGLTQAEAQVTERRATRLGQGVAPQHEQRRTHPWV